MLGVPALAEQVALAGCLDSARACMSWRMVMLMGAFRGTALAGLGCALLVLVLAGPVAAASDTTVADAVLGQPDFSTNFVKFGCPPPTASSLCHPTAVAMDPTSGRIFITDGRRVLSWSNTHRITTDEPADLVLGQSSFTAVECQATAHLVCFAAGVTVDREGRVYVSDAGLNRVIRFTPPLQSGMAADLVIGRPDFTTGPQPCIVSPDEPNPPTIIVTARDLCNPTGLVVDSQGRLYVADTSNSRVLRFDHTDTNYPTAELLLGQPSFTESPAQSLGCIVEPLGFTTNPDGLCRPIGITLDRTGRLYVADSFQSRVVRYDDPHANAQPADAILGTGCPFGQAAGPTDFCIPAGVFVDHTDRLYVTDAFESRTVRIGANGQTTEGVVFGHPNANEPNCLNGTPSADSLCAPTSASVDFRGDVFIADADNNRVLRYDQPSNGTPPPVVS
jgi:sugar lactone lactonase YvrE